MKTTPLRNILYLLQKEGYPIGSKICKALIDEQVQKGIWQLEQSILKEIAASKGKYGSAQVEWMSSSDSEAARELIRQCIKAGWIEGADSAEAMELIHQCIKEGGY